MPRIFFSFRALAFLAVMSSFRFPRGKGLNIVVWTRRGMVRPYGSMPGRAAMAARAAAMRCLAAAALAGGQLPKPRPVLAP